MDDLLTTKQLQELLQVDRITIYRMLNDGRLRGFKVGGQWRFSRQEIDTWLQEQQAYPLGTDTPPSPSSSIVPSPEALPLSCVQAIQGVCAEALDIGVVTVDLDGTSLTGISNSCRFCNLILSTEKGRRRCASDWKQVSRGQTHTCHAGLLCINAPVEIDHKQVAITAGCQFALQAITDDEPAVQRISILSTELGLDERELRASASTVRLVQGEDLPRLSRLLQRAAATFAEIGQERLNLLSRLQHISEMSKIT